MLSFLTHAWQPQVHSGSGRRRRTARRSAWRPRLEFLEDRCVPTTFAVTSAGDDVADKGTLRYAVANAVSGDTILLTDGLKNTPVVLTHGELLLTQNVTIKSDGDGPDTISGGYLSRVFEVAAGASVTLSNLILTGGNGVANNSAGNLYWDRNGGAILVDDLGTLAVDHCTFIDNSVFNGGGDGGAAFNLGTMTVNYSTVFRNSAYDFGGGLANFINKAAMTVNNSTVSANYALIFGGGLFNQGTLMVSGSSLHDNSNDTSEPFFYGGGGAIFNTNFESNTGVLTVTGCALYNNHANEGGAIENGVGTLYVYTSSLHDNSAVDDGGAILNTGGPTATVSGSSLYNNSAGNEGGGIYNHVFAALTVSGSVLYHNNATNGGGIFNFGTLTVSGSSLYNNSAVYGGGGIFNGIFQLSNGTYVLGMVTVSGSTLGNTLPPNTAANGGGIFNQGQLTITQNTVVSGNQATLGGDLYEDLKDSPTASFSKDSSCTIIDIYIAM
jgi:hypothetical protein